MTVLEATAMYQDKMDLTKFEVYNFCNLASKARKVIIFMKRSIPTCRYRVLTKQVCFYTCPLCFLTAYKVTSHPSIIA